MIKIITLLILLGFFLLAGCKTSQNRPAYTWQNYSSSLYILKKDPSEANLKNHKDVLLSIMEESKKENCRVPPGVYCEYGYLILKEGRTDEALQYFDLEERTYPESTIFIQNLKKYAVKKIKQDNEPQVDNVVENETNKESGGTETIKTESK